MTQENKRDEIKAILKSTHATSCHTKQKPRCECGVEELENQLAQLVRSVKDDSFQKGFDEGQMEMQGSCECDCAACRHCEEIKKYA